MDIEKLEKLAQEAKAVNPTGESYECFDSGTSLVVEGIGNCHPEEGCVFLKVHDGAGRFCLVPVVSGDRVIILHRRQYPRPG